MKLKEFYQRYADFVLGIYERDAYELERVLKDTKGFTRGRPGPGGGAEAIPFTVAYILIALMANGPRRQAKETAWAYYHIEQEGSNTAEWTADPDDEAHFQQCPLTGATMFGDALTQLLDNPTLAEKVEEIVVSRDWEEARIIYRKGRSKLQSRFISAMDEGKSQRADKHGKLRTYCHLGGSALHEMAVDLGEHRGGR